MKIRWCWRCQMDVPMLNEEEYKIAHQLYGKGFRNREAGVKRELCFKELLDYYKEVTGFEETNPNAIMHHRIALYGADCPNCKKPLRTDKARYCAACGFGKEDFINQATKPLMERKKELFKPSTIMSQNQPARWLKILLCVLVCLGVGYASSFATAEGVGTWYKTVNKPSFNPPNWLFAPVWTVLYIMMGVAAGLVWDRGWDNVSVRTALYLFIAQLVLNGFWSVAFFGMQNPLLALGIILLLWALIFMCIRRFMPLNRTAAWLLVPYLLWVSFATVLNASIWYLN